MRRGGLFASAQMQGGMRDKASIRSRTSRSQLKFMDNEKAIRKGVNRIASKKDSPQRNSPSAASGLRPLRAESFAETPHVAEAFFGGASGDQPGCARRSASQPSKRRKRRFRNHSSSPDLRRNHPPPSAKRSDVHRNQTKCSSCSISLNDPVSIPIVFP